MLSDGTQRSRLRAEDAQQACARIPVHTEDRRELVVTTMNAQPILRWKREVAVTTAGLLERLACGDTHTVGQELVMFYELSS